MIDKNSLEDLPDEILIEICYYLNAFDIIYSFGRLNRRFQCAISEFCSKLNFCSFSLNKFQRFYSPYLLNLICERVITLSLSNEYCPGQIELFENLIVDKSFKEKLPLLKCLTLTEFTNNNINILSKILYIEELNIEFSSYEKLTNENEEFLIFNLFNTSNNLKKVNLNTGCGLKLKSKIESKTNLKELSIQLDTINDLLILFQILPNLIHLQVDIHNKSSLTSISEDKIALNLKELYLHTIDKEIIPFKTIFKPLISNICSIEYLSLGLRTDDPDYANAINWIDLINSMPNLNTFIIGLEIELTADLIYLFNIQTLYELKQSVFDSFHLHLSSFPVSIYINSKTLFIDSIPYRFNRDQSYNTSPEAASALNTNIEASQQSPHHICGLSMNGEHIPNNQNDYLYVINRFPHIKWLYLDWINIIDQNKEDEEIRSSISVKLKYLKCLIYMRSTLCKVNRNFFDKLFNDHKQLDTLKMMYGDLIYLLRNSLPSINGNHIKNLLLSSCGADGKIHLNHLKYFISTFPFLENLCIEVTSKNLIKKNQMEIINQLIISFKNLRSFKIVSQRGELKFVRILMENEQIKFEWLSNINALGSHLILQPKYLALWKSDSQITYF